MKIVLFIILIIGMLFFFAIGIFLACFWLYPTLKEFMDRKLGQKMDGKAIVIAKEHILSHYEEPALMFNFSYLLHFYFPEKWVIKVKVETGEKILEVSELVFDTIENGEKIDISYVVGKFSGKHYL